VENGVHVASAHDVYGVLVLVLHHWVDDHGLLAVASEAAVGAGVECEWLCLFFPHRSKRMLDSSAQRTDIPF
jgi:hypothetical protein